MTNTKVQLFDDNNKLIDEREVTMEVTEAGKNHPLYTPTTNEYGISEKEVLSNHLVAIFEDIEELCIRTQLSEAMGAHIDNYSGKCIDNVRGIPEKEEIEADLVFLEDMLDQIKGRIKDAREHNV